MLPFYRIAEIVIYTVLNFLPFLLLALYPFRKQLRFSGAVTAIMVLLLTVIQISIALLTATHPGQFNGLFSLVSTAIYGIFYFTAVKAAFGKTLFTLLMLSNVANLAVMSAKCMEGLVFGREMALQAYRWTYSLCLLITSFLVAVPLSLYFRKYYSDGISKQAGASSWNYLWLIPATFYLLWYWPLYQNEATSLERALQPSTAFFTLFINLGAFLVYHTVVCLINEQEKSSNLAAQNHQLEIQSLQYENLNRQIAATRQARHDLRHHIAVMDSYLTSGEYGKLHEYLQGYKQSLPNDSSVLFCKHETANILLLYFAQQAKEKQIDFSATASLPEQIGVPDNVLSVLLGNLLENALEACLTVRDRQAWISVKAKAQPDAVFIQIENTYGKEPVKDREGRYLSSKHKGLGVGLESVKNIASQYDGLLEIELENGCFRVSVLLNLS